MQKVITVITINPNKISKHTDKCQNISIVFSTPVNVNSYCLHNSAVTGWGWGQNAAKGAGSGWDVDKNIFCGAVMGSSTCPRVILYRKDFYDAERDLSATAKFRVVNLLVCCDCLMNKLYEMLIFYLCLGPNA